MVKEQQQYEKELQKLEEMKEQKALKIAQRVNELNSNIENSDAEIVNLEKEKYIMAVVDSDALEMDSKIKTEQDNKHVLMQKKDDLLMQILQEQDVNEPEAGDDKGDNLSASLGVEGSIGFRNQKEMDAYSDKMENLYHDLGIPYLLDKHHFKNGSVIYVMNHPEICRGKDLLLLSHADVRELRAAIDEEMKEGQTYFSKRYQTEIGDWITGEDALRTENQDSSERKVLGAFTQMLADRENGAVSGVDSSENEDHSSISDLEAEPGNLSGIEGLEDNISDNKLTAKQQGFKVTIRLLQGKLEEIKAILAETGEQDNQDDFKEQIEMLSNLIDEQRLREVEEADNIMMNTLDQEEELQEQDRSEEFIIEVMLKEKEMRDLAKFCEQNGIDIEVAKEGRVVLGEYTRAVLSEGQGTSQSMVVGH